MWKTLCDNVWHIYVMLWIQMYIDFSFFDTWKSEEDEAIQTKHMFSEIPGLKIPGRFCVVWNTFVITFLGWEVKWDILINQPKKQSCEIWAILSKCLCIYLVPPNPKNS